MFTGTALAQAYPLAFVSVSKVRSAHDQNSWNVVSQKTPAGSNPASPANLGFGGVSPHLNLGWFRLAEFDLALRFRGNYTSILIFGDPSLALSSATKSARRLGRLVGRYPHLLSVARDSSFSLGLSDLFHWDLRERFSWFQLNWAQRSCRVFLCFLIDLESLLLES